MHDIVIWLTVSQNCSGNQLRYESLNKLKRLWPNQSIRRINHFVVNVDNIEQQDFSNGATPYTPITRTCRVSANQSCHWLKKDFLFLQLGGWDNLVKSRLERLQRSDQILCSMKCRDYTRGNPDTATLRTIDEAFQLSRSGVLCASRKAFQVFV